MCSDLTDMDCILLSDTDTNRHFRERVEIEIKSVKTGLNPIPSQHSLKYTFVLLSISKCIACPIITEDLRVVKFELKQLQSFQLVANSAPLFQHLN